MFRNMLQKNKIKWILFNLMLQKKATCLNTSHVDIIYKTLHFTYQQINSSSGG